MKQARLSILYIIFAILATAVNLLVQMLVVYLYQGHYYIELSILAGTASGLPLKYLLDKRHIFAFKSRNISHDGHMFFLYSFTGVFTTLIFWGVEYSFQWIFGTDLMRYIGGALGLGLGYILKYHLDKRFVFVRS